MNYSVSQFTSLDLSQKLGNFLLIRLMKFFNLSIYFCLHLSIETGVWFITAKRLKSLKQPTTRHVSLPLQFK
ncbi:hypothetical protein AQUCO_00200606v1 [Aquilegia coerulea]|uniref:Uncharacterized protein n=1 Tax=Aquilegia coerulea TaxID=218851 RepID=A0A2G5F469_AQUCA|nr:hypothetical protein AQUCO_00200606v1 [Aquilegia coerulea]